MTDLWIWILFLEPEILYKACKHFHREKPTLYYWKFHQESLNESLCIFRDIYDEILDES